MSRIERGRGNPSLDFVELMAKHLEVAPQALFELPDDLSDSGSPN